MNINLSAQKQSFDIVSYTPPKGWTETPGNSNVSYSRIENGNWAQITIYKSVASSGTVDTDFDKYWKELVAVNKNISTTQKSNPKSADGWMIQSGNGNQLSLTPAKGKAGWWNKDRKSKDVNKWGSFRKAAAYKLETATYSIEIKVDNNYSDAIILNSNKPTERDGGQFNNPPYRFAYVHREESLIDNPPGSTF